MMHHSEHENPDGLKVGEAVRVKSPVKLMHLPKFKEGVQMSGKEGTIKDLILFSKEGVEVSSNRPVLVTFTDPKCQAHFEFEELIRVE